MKKTNLVLLPGLLNDAQLWEHQAEQLADIAYVDAGDITQADSMSALAAAVLAKAPYRFALAALSMGGYVAFEMLRQAPERIIGLALLDTSARPDTSEATENRRRRMELAEKDFLAAVRVQLPSMIHPAHLKNDSIVGAIEAMAHRVGKDAFMRQQRAIMARVDSRPYLGKITCPTLVLCGRNDAITPVAIHDEMAAAIPNATQAVIDDCGHLSPLEQPEATTRALRDWLQHMQH